MHVSFETNPVEFTKEGIIRGKGLPGFGRINQLRSNIFFESIWTKDKLFQEAIFWASHKAITVVSIPSNILACGLSLMGAALSASTLGLYNITTFALTLGNNERFHIDTKVVSLITGSMVSSFQVVQNVMEVAASPIWLLSRIYLGLRKIVEKEAECILDAPWLKQVERRTRNTRIEPNQDRPLKKIFSHYAYSLLNVPVHVVNAAVCGVISTIATGVFLMRASLYATIAQEIDFPSYAGKFSLLTAISGYRVVEDVSVAVADIFVLLYKVGCALRLERLANKAWKVISYIPEAILEEESKSYIQTFQNEGFGIFGRLNKERSRYSEISLQNNDELLKELGYWFAHKGFSVLSMPVNLSAAALGTLIALGSACTLGVAKIAYFAFTGAHSRNKLNIETRSRQMLVGAGVSLFHVVKNGGELLASPFFILNRLWKGLENSADQEPEFPDQESFLVKWIEEPTKQTRIVYGEERSVKKVFRHYFHSMVNIPTHALNVVASGVATVALGSFFVLKSVLYAATKVNVPLATRFHWTLGSSAVSLGHIIEDITTAVEDVFVLLYHTADFINNVFKIGNIAKGVWRLLMYIPSAVRGS